MNILLLRAHKAALCHAGEENRQQACQKEAAAGKDDLRRRLARRNLKELVAQIDERNRAAPERVAQDRKAHDDGAARKKRFLFHMNSLLWLYCMCQYTTLRAKSKREDEVFAFPQPLIAAFIQAFS